MATAQQSSSISHNAVFETTLGRATEAPIPVPVPDIDKALRIANVLQTTLEWDKVVEIFAYEIRKIIEHSSVHYRNATRNLEWHRGVTARHTFTYALVILGESLGELTLTRKRKFTVAETRTLEYLLCSLMYPLRNALLYKTALQAALKDPLTGVCNRAALDETLAREVDLAHRHGSALSLIAIDIDHFKRVNDVHGHAVGDTVIKAVAQAALSRIRSSDVLFRYGGEEFVVLLSNTDSVGAMTLAERIRQAVSGCGAEVAVSVSLGVACLDTREDARALFVKADQALYQAKAAGRNCVRFVSVAAG